VTIPKNYAYFADQVKSIVRADPAMRGVNDNWSEEVKSLHLDVTNTVRVL
jgi:multidrug efflux pump